MGFATINDNGVGGVPIKNIEDEANKTFKDAKHELLEKIYKSNMYPKSDDLDSTPLLGALSNAGRYFTHGIDPDSDFFGTVDGSTPVLVDSSHNNTTEGSASPSPVLDKSPIFNENNNGQCQQNFTVLFSDGAWTDSITGYGNVDSLYKDTENEAGDTTLYDIYGGRSYDDNESNTLADIAMYYFANDLASGVTDGLAVDLHGDEVPHQHMNTFTVGLGVNGYKDSQPPNYTDTFAWWANARGSAVTTNDLVARIDDLRHAASNGRGAYSDVNKYTALNDELDAVIAEIFTRVSATAAGASFSDVELFSSGNFRYDLKYSTDTWWGDVRAFSFNSDSDSFETNYTWSAKAALYDLGADRHTDREIITFNGTQGIPFAFPSDYYNSHDTTTQLSVTQVNDLLKDPPFPNPTNASEKDSNQTYVEALVNYLRGDGTHDGTAGTYEFRDRENNYLGALLHSRPQYVGAPSARYSDTLESGVNGIYSTFVSTHKDRRHMIYVGGNDGMLHGFYATNDPNNTNDTSGGNEVFAYIPSFISDATLGGNLLSRFADADGDGTGSGYQGQAYVDGTPVVADVYVDKGTDAARWRTYLVAGMRSGAKGIYVLDVTNPDSDTRKGDNNEYPRLDKAEDNAASIVVKEFTHPELGYVYGQPEIARMNNGRWAAVVPNGYNSHVEGVNGGTGGSASLFIIYLDNDDGGLDTDDSNNDGIYNDGQGDYSIIKATMQWVFCAREHQGCVLPESSESIDVRYGTTDGLIQFGGSVGQYKTSYAYRDSNEYFVQLETTPVRENGVTYDVIHCSNSAFLHDPLAAVEKNCEYLDPNGLSDATLVDTNTDGTVDRVYAGDLRGNLWIFDLSEKDSSTDQKDAYYWDTHTGRQTYPVNIYTDSFVYQQPFFSSCSVNTTDGGTTYNSDLRFDFHQYTYGRCSPENRQAITSAPLVRKNPLTNNPDTDPNYLVFFGTGQYIVGSDKLDSNTRSHHVYGVWDAGESNNNGPYNVNLNTDSLTKQTVSLLSGSTTERTVTSNPVDYNVSSGSKNLGWYMVLPAQKERVILSPLLLGRALLFATIIPAENDCIANAGDSFLMAVNPLTGGLASGTPLSKANDGTALAGIKYSNLIIGLSAIKTKSGTKVITTQADSSHQEYTIFHAPSSSLTDTTPGSTFPHKGRKSWSILK